jgi:hypothetical protein
VGPSAGLGVLKKNKTCCTGPESNPGRVTNTMGLNHAFLFRTLIGALKYFCSQRRRFDDRILQFVFSIRHLQPFMNLSRLILEVPRSHTRTHHSR